MASKPEDTGPKQAGLAQTARLCYIISKEVITLLTVLLSALQMVAATPPPQPPKAVLRTPEPEITLDDLVCPKSKVQHARDWSRLRTRNLGELPPGDLHLTVVRRVGDCTLRTVIRTGIGEGGR